VIFLLLIRRYYNKCQSTSRKDKSLDNPNVIRQLFEEFQEKPIAYQRVYSEITGSVVAGLVLSQLVYWDKTMKHKWFYKTDQDFSDELGVSVYELRAAKKKIKELKLVETKLKGVPAKTNYKVNIDLLINKIVSLRKSRKLDCVKTTNKIKGKSQSITDNNTDNKSDINNYNLSHDKSAIASKNKTIKKTYKKNYKQAHPISQFLDEYNHLKDKEVLTEAIKYYIDCYGEKVGTTPSNIKVAQWLKVETNLNAFQDENGLGEDDWILLLEQWFKKIKDTDFNIIHFATGEIMQNCLFNAGLYN